MLELVEQFIRNAGVDTLVNFYAKNLAGWTATKLMESLAGGPQEHAAPETWIEHSLVRRSDGPPDKKLSDLSVRIVSAQRF